MSRRVWFARDTGFTSDPRVQVLGDEYGPGGPLAVEEMMALAKLANAEGAVSAPYATIARRSFVTPGVAKQVVADAVDSGLIEIVESGAKVVSAVFIKWSTWQPKDPTAAARKARQRAEESHGDVTP